MADKDVAERALLGHDDVFANAFNALLLGGDAVDPSELRDAATHSGWQDALRLRDQDRDVAKEWRGCGMRLAYLGAEDQSAPDPDMALRVVGYDGASYRAQVDARGGRRVPVVTIVLYFGHEPWVKELHLLDRLDVPPELSGLVNDWRVPVFDMSRLEPGQLGRLRHDLRAVADYLAQTRDGGVYQPPGDLTLMHPADTMRVMRAITGDATWEEAILPDDEKGGEATMTEVLERYINKGMSAGRAEGRAEGEARGRAEGARVLVERFGMTVQQALDAMGVPDAQRDAVLAFV